MTPEDCLISQPDFDSFVADHLAFLKLILRDKPTSIIPHLAIKTIDMDGSPGVTLAALAINFNEDDEKRDALMRVGRSIYKQQQIPMAVAFFSEAWTVRRKHGDRNRTEPRHSPDRREVAIIFATSFDKSLSKIISLPIHRDPQNRIEVTDEDTSTQVDGHPRLLAHFFHGFAQAAGIRSPVFSPYRSSRS